MRPLGLPDVTVPQERGHPRLWSGPLVGAVAFARPIGKSHYVPAAWGFPSKPGQLYKPSSMSPLAFEVTLVKAKEHTPFLDDVVLSSVYDLLIDILRPFWSGTVVYSRQEAIGFMDLSKSPGWPDCDGASTKWDALCVDPSGVDRRCTNLEHGHTHFMPFLATLKDELRPEAKVFVNATRVFLNGPMEHEITSKRLMQWQDDALLKSVGRHPFTIGIRVPGSQFVTIMLSLGGRWCWNWDGSGFDLRFHPRLARLVRDVRCRFLPPEFHEVSANLYDAAHAGYRIIGGNVHPMVTNPSGKMSTGQDNGIMHMGALAYGCLALYKLPHQALFRLMRSFLNGDDGMGRFAPPLHFPTLAAFLKTNVNVHLETLVDVPRAAAEMTFLSFSLVSRYVDGVGEFLCAAGNLDKLLSSVYWVPLRNQLPFHVSSFSHALGLRLALFPWREHFLALEDLCQDFWAKHKNKPGMKQCLPAWLTEKEIALLHCRLEGFSFFSTRVVQDQDPSHLLKLVGVHMNPGPWVLKGVGRPIIRCSFVCSPWLLPTSWTIMSCRLCKKFGPLCRVHGTAPANATFVLTPRSGKVRVNNKESDATKSIHPPRAPFDMKVATARLHEMAHFKQATRALVSSEKKMKASAHKPSGKAWHESVFGFLGKAAKYAASIAPAILPFLVAGHTPTATAVSMGLQLPTGLQQGSARPSVPNLLQLASTSPVAGAAPLALPMSMRGQVGIHSVRSGNRANGAKIIRVRGCDLVGSYTGTGSEALGSVMATWDLNFSSGAFANTRVSQFANSYEKWRPVKLAFIYEPGCPATSTGQAALYVETDPDQPVAGSGISNAQAAAAHEGYDAFNSWSVGLTHVPIDRQFTDMFVNSNGSDARLSSAGQLVLSGLGAWSTSPQAEGTIFVLYDIEFSIPQLSVSNSERSSGFWRATSISGATTSNPWGTTDPVTTIQPPGALTVLDVSVGGQYLFYNVPVGNWYVWLETDTGSSITAIVLNAVGMTRTLLNALVNSAGTGANSMYNLSVPNDSSLSPKMSGTNYFYVTATGGTGSTVRMVIAPSTVTLSRPPRVKTLQDYEKLVDCLESRVLALEGPSPQPIDVSQPSEDKGKEREIDAFRANYEQAMLDVDARLARVHSMATAARSHVAAPPQLPVASLAPVAQPASVKAGVRQ